MRKFKLNGEELVLPESWDEITFDQYLKLMDLKTDGDNDYSKLLSIFIGIDADTVRNAIIYNLDTVIETLSFVSKEPAFTGQVTTFMGVEIPKDITFEQLAPFEDMRSLINKSSSMELKDAVAQYAKYCAIYVQLKRDGVYKYGKAMELVSEVNKQKAREVMLLGSFFLIKVIRLTKSIKLTYQTQSWLRKKWRRATKIFTRLSDSLRLS